MKENLPYIFACVFYNHLKFFSKGSNFMACHHKESPIFIWAVFMNEYYIPNQIFWSNMYVYEYKGYWKNILFK